MARVHHEAAADVVAFKKNDESFTYLIRRPKPNWDDDIPDPNATSYPGATPGPEPVPDWVITSGDARDEELGILKSGKEADVILIERTLGDAVNLLAAKRYRDTDHRTFRNDAAYRMGKEPREGRVARAIKKQTHFGSAARAGVWAAAEFEMLTRLWDAGLPVPYPVQFSGTEVVLEYLGDEEYSAPRLSESKPSRDLLEHLRDQAVALLWGLAGAGVVHGDLSAYNTLVWAETLYVIDLPQAAELTDVTRASQYNSNALDFLQRDCQNLLGWFQKKGVDTPDPDALFGELVAAAFAPRFD